MPSVGGQCRSRICPPACPHLVRSKRAVLVGEAAHAVYPALGQGANAALEGAAMLAATIAGAGGSQGETWRQQERARQWLR